MSLQTLMQAGPIKANDLFAKLFDTSDDAIQTREQLFDDLKSELELHASLEEQHLFPVLRGNPETQELANGAEKDTETLRAKLAELQILPKNDGGFVDQLRTLQQSFRQHALDEKQEVLPAVRQALDRDQMVKVVDDVETSITEAEHVRHSPPRRARTRTPAEQPVEAHVIEAKPDEIADQVVHAPEVATQMATEATQEVAATAQMTLADAASASHDIAHKVTQQTTRTISDLQAVMSLPSAAIQSLETLRGAWFSYVTETTQATTRMSRELLWQASEQQRQFAFDMAERWMTRNANWMRASLDASGVSELEIPRRRLADPGQDMQARP